MSSYAAIVARIRTSPIEGAKTIQRGHVLGYDVVTGLDTEDDQLGVYFPCDGQLSDEFCQANDLYPRYDSSGERVNSGYIDPKNRRIRAQNFFGCRSDGLWVPLSYFDYLKGVSLREGDMFTELAGNPICCKYETQRTKNARGNNQQAKKRRKNVMFLEHPDTKQLAYEIGQIPEGTPFLVTEKVHGTCLLADAKIRLWDKRTKNLSRLQVGDKVIGFDEATKCFMPATVMDVFSSGPSDAWVDVVTKRRKVGMGNHYAKITCTRYHEFYIEGQWVSACDLIPGKHRITLPRRELIPTEKQRSILLGKLLGDGYLAFPDRISSCVQLGHAEQHKDYLFYCTESLGNLVKEPFAENVFTSGYGSKMYRNRTIFLAGLQDIFGSLYNESGRTVPEWVADRLDPIALAFWYMDDGSLSHSDLQRDRASFATNAYDESSIDILLRGLARFHINGVKYNNGDGWRIRLNTDDAYRLFNIILPYVPKCMQYKLPEELRGAETTNIRTNAEYWWIPQVDDIISVEPSRRSRSMMWDVTTDTGNFVAHDILVHNSQRQGVVSETKNINQSFWQRLLRYVGANIPTEHQEWMEMLGTRHVIVDDTSNGGFYGSNEFRHKVANQLRGKLRKGECVYYEVVGWTDTGKQIMPSVDTTKSKNKDLRKRYGKKMTYSYGLPEGECDFYVYRIAISTEDGHQFDLPWNQVKHRCEELGVKHVPELDSGVFGEDRKAFLEYIDQLADGPSTLDDRHIREGVCVRFELPSGPKILKHKSFDFKVLEGIAKEDDNYEDMEEAS